MKVQTKRIKHICPDHNLPLDRICDYLGKFKFWKCQKCSYAVYPNKLTKK